MESFSVNSFSFEKMDYRTQAEASFSFYNKNNKNDEDDICYQFQFFGYDEEGCKTNFTLRCNDPPSDAKIEGDDEYYEAEGLKELCQELNLKCDLLTFAKFLILLVPMRKNSNMVFVDWKKIKILN